MKKKFDKFMYKLGETRDSNQNPSLSRGTERN
jgi:hypothetical protein